MGYLKMPEDRVDKYASNHTRWRSRLMQPCWPQASAAYLPDMSMDPHSILSGLLNLNLLPPPGFAPELSSAARISIMSSSQVQGTGYTEDDLQRIREAYAQADNQGDQVIENPVANPQNRLTTISVACIIANRMIGDH
jgi:hypothetical protein